jgi:hypothetical protein
MCLWRIMDGFEKMLWILWIFPNDFSSKLLTKLWPILVIFFKVSSKSLFKTSSFFSRPSEKSDHLWSEILTLQGVWEMELFSSWAGCQHKESHSHFNTSSQSHLTQSLLLYSLLLLFLTINISFKSIFVSTYFIILPFFQS